MKDEREVVERVNRATPVLTESSDDISAVESPSSLKCAVAADKMNVFYIGVNNPVSISVSDVSPSDVQVSISNGSITLAENGFIVKVQKPGEARLTVSAMQNGEVKRVGEYPFRVKRVPDPKPMFGGKGPWDRKIHKAAALRTDVVNAYIPNCDFDLPFEVTSFSFTAILDDIPITVDAKDNKLTPRMKEMIGKSEVGQKIYLENVKAKGPDGTIRKLGTLTFKLI